MNAARLFEDTGGGFVGGGMPLIVDSFAGGGGASTGIEIALGRSPDIAINHDADALAMHQVNHPETLHLSKNIWKVDPLEAVGIRRVGLAWFSPDCKHFSKAKGGRPVKRSIRDLAWVVVLWAKRVRPEVIILENVEEFREWGPVLPDGKPCPERKGAIFRKWTAELKRLGYKLDWRELRACDYGAPTIRKRFFMIARRDGRPIVWPEPTHGPPGDPELIAGRKLPWRTAAEIIDWSIPSPSIFDSSEEIMARFGVRAIRPLADATMRRIARGVMRYVLEAKKPFIVRTDMASAAQRNGVHDVAAPINTLTTAGSFAVVAPVMTAGQHGGSVSGADQPSHITASQKDQNAVIVPTFVSCGGRTIAAVHLSRFTQNGVGSGADEPVDTVMAGAPKFGVVAAFMAQHTAGTHPGKPAHSVEKPVSTISATGSQQSVVAAHLLNLHGSDRCNQAAEKPAPTAMAGGTHAALIAGFLTKYYGTANGARIDDPLHTNTTKDRMGLVTVEIDGTTYAIADIGMRMLTPRERFRAQGFPDSYIIDRRADGTTITQTVQGACCGNSVCPPLAAALVRANCGHLAEAREAAE